MAVTPAAMAGPAGGARSAYEQIRQAIIEGVYRPGQRLIEVRVAEEFALSRTPVREALRLLEAEGLVRSEPNRGAMVRTFSTREVYDLYELRSRLEAYAAELAAERASDEHLAELDRGVELFGSAVAGSASGDIDAIRSLQAANGVFHTAVVTAARHERLAGLLAKTVDVPLVFQAFRRYGPDEVRRSHQFHSLIRDALVARDGDRAGRLMAEHVLQGRDTLVAALGGDERESDAPFELDAAPPGPRSGRGLTSPSRS